MANKALNSTDIKKLWGLAAGRCSRPDCAQECIRFLDSNDPTIIGEMAHIIAKKPGGPRGQAGGGEDTYENLILLCPTHHTEIDKAPDGVFPVELIHKWKLKHEERIRNFFVSPTFADRYSLGSTIKRLLIENKATWQHYGPESSEAQTNPLSNLAEIWQFQKLATIVPNNRRIILLIEQNKDQIEINDYIHCVAFVEHAKGFERSCYIRTEGVPLFPVTFERLVDRYARLQ